MRINPVLRYAMMSRIMTEMDTPTVKIEPVSVTRTVLRQRAGESLPS
jgi:hypothetical protein